MARVHGRAEGPGIGRLSLCELPVQRLLLDPVPEGFALLPQGRQVIQRRTDRGGIRIRDQLKVDSDQLEGLTVGVLHVRQGRVESPAEHVVKPQIAEHECRSGENFIHTGHEPEGAIVNVPPKRTRKLHRLGARFLPHSLNRRQRFFSELMGEGQHAAGDLGLAKDRHDPRGNPVPLGQASSRGAFEHPHRLTAAHQITELCRKIGDGVNQAADLISATASIPSLNFIPLTTFGNWF
jgi:hypothetical protein